ncbi:MAG: ABC transporter permease [Acidimicrobiia bacterium]|nr:MAG: ABC transporter permease [Acidimicrobiia bacterium]
MTAPAQVPSRLSIIATIVQKDFKAFTRDRLYLFLSILGLVAYVAIFWMLPNTVDETVTIGATGAGVQELLARATGEDEAAGLDVVAFDSRETLVTAVEEGDDDVALGLAFPDDFFASVAAGRPTTVTVVATAEVPAELRSAMESFVREAAFAIAGSPLPVEFQEEILGVDRVGNQVTLREQFRPLLAFLVLLIEMLSLAGLLASEMQSRTVTAVITTPARLSDFLTAKVVFGASLAFGQVVLLLLAIRSLDQQPVLLLTFLLLGSLMVTAFALVAGSYGKDFISVLFTSLIFLIPMMIPAFSLLFPGSASSWVQAIPTYGLVQGIVEVTSYGAGWADSLSNLGMVAGWTVVAFVFGLGTLRRKVHSL